MTNDNYVIDDARGKAWGSPDEALIWYREQLNARDEQIRIAIEAERAAWTQDDIYEGACMVLDSMGKRLGL